jgi:hypothetical protein
MMIRRLSHCVVLVGVLCACKKDGVPATAPPVAAEAAVDKPVRPAPSGPSGPAAPPVPSIADDWPGTETQLAMYRAFSVKDPAPECAEVEALDPEPLAGLQLIAEEIAMPPYAGMRAATCIATRHAEAGVDILVGWMGNPEVGGLVRLALQQVDSWPESVRETVGQAALAGPHAAVAAPLLKTDD